MNKQNEYDRIIEAVGSIKSIVDYKPEIAIILGTGLGALADDIETEKVVSGNILSCQALNTMTLRWIGILYDKVDIEFTASRGIFTGEQVIKNLLVGAQTTQIVSAIYEEGTEIISSMTHTLKDWMFRHNYKTIDEFRGNASQKNIKKPVLYERTQFMRYFSDAKYK